MGRRWVGGGAAPGGLAFALFLILPVAAGAEGAPTAAALGADRPAEWRIDRWSAHIREASARFAIPARWIRRVMRAESGGREIAGGQPTVSRAGAMGLMQLMPATWRDMRSLVGLGPDPHDPRDNILAGAAYLRLMYDRFGYPGLFAAYNAGPARYAAALSGARQLPVETRFYVARVSGGVRPTRGFARSAAAGAPATPAAGLFVIAPATGLFGAAPRLSPQRSRGLFIQLAGGIGR